VISTGPFSFFRGIGTAVFVSGILFFSACRKEKEGAPPSPTAYTPELPWYFEAHYAEPADNPSTREGILLGKTLFFDPILSADQKVSCASCHQPEKGFADGLPIATGIGGRKGRRHTPGLLNAGIRQRFFWDGRSPGLEDQSLHPIQNPVEMGLTLPEMERRLQASSRYPALFARAFGDSRTDASRVAKALAQFQRSLLSKNSKYDLYLRGLYTPTAEESLGIRLFSTHPDPFALPTVIRGGNCMDCHQSHTLTGRAEGFEGFHNTGLVAAGSTDRGLMEVTGKSADFGRFKTPGLRNVALSAPYMHDGRFRTLEEVLDHYNSDTLFFKPNVDPQILAGSNVRMGESLGLTTAEKKAIIAFLHMLTDSSALKVP
jgi:cytochrome c peroxidase